MAALKNNIAIKWFNGSIGQSVIISDPDSNEKAWARIEFLIPYGDVINRPSVRVSPQKGNKTYQQIIAWHKTMWDDERFCKFPPSYVEVNKMYETSNPEIKK